MGCNTPEAEIGKKQKTNNWAGLLFFSSVISCIAGGWTALLSHNMYMFLSMIGYFIAFQLFLRFTPPGKKLKLKLLAQEFYSPTSSTSFSQPFQSSSIGSSSSYDFPHPQSTLSLTSRCSGSNYY